MKKEIDSVGGCACLRRCLMSNDTKTKLQALDADFEKIKSTLASEFDQSKLEERPDAVDEAKRLATSVGSLLRDHSNTGGHPAEFQKIIKDAGPAPPGEDEGSWRINTLLANLAPRVVHCALNTESSLPPGQTSHHGSDDLDIARSEQSPGLLRHEKPITLVHNSSSEHVPERLLAPEHHKPEKMLDASVKTPLLAGSSTAADQDHMSTFTSSHHAAAGGKPRKPTLRDLLKASPHAAEFRIPEDSTERALRAH
eukprot:TRINITY_DN38157_c0_g1_i1.p1 TRINITY_DN38157_c0_g1~~TRINITY_DN38157_c0_g1_i1.p1  ORF type:complete len:254 (+),score=43.19 TRINITY_DN38157_c0_g1_i1:182-943(+)